MSKRKRIEPPIPFGSRQAFVAFCKAANARLLYGPAGERTGLVFYLRRPDVVATDYKGRPFILAKGQRRGCCVVFRGVDGHVYVGYSLYHERLERQPFDRHIAVYRACQRRVDLTEYMASRNCCLLPEEVSHDEKGIGRALGVSFLAAAVPHTIRALWTTAGTTGLIKLTPKTPAAAPAVKQEETTPADPAGG